MKKQKEERIQEAARLQNLARQAMFSGSPTIAIGAIGSKPYGPGVVVNVAGSVISNEDLMVTVQNGLRTVRRRGNPGKIEI